MTEKKPRGFAAMSPERRREIASMGGKAQPPEKRSFSKNRELAAAAGYKGGRSIRAGKRTFSRDPLFASAMGRKGGLAMRKRASKKDAEV